MSATPPAHLLAPFLAAADAVAREREDVDAATAREVMGEAATLLHNGLADPSDVRAAYLVSASVLQL